MTYTTPYGPRSTSMAQSSSFMGHRCQVQHQSRTRRLDFPSPRYSILTPISGDVTRLTHLIHYCTNKVPHETFKAAAQLVVSGKTQRFSRLDIILAHMGGSTLALAPRVAGLARYMGATLSEDEILIEFRRFWLDTALSGDGDGGTLTATASSCGAETRSFRDRILWGSDFPGE